MSTWKDELASSRALTLLPLCVVVNVAIGGIISVAKVPLYLDAIGTILATLLLGWRAGAVTGVLSFLLASLIISPVYVFFSGTQVVIALYVYLVASGLRAFRTPLYVALAGVGLGIVAGLVSAPVIAVVFKGVSGSGRDLITAFLISSGEQVIKAVALSGIASEPIDKALQILTAYGILRSIPQSLLSHYRNPLLQSNGLLGKE